MANEKRLIDANAILYEYCQANGCNEVIDEVCPNCFTAGLIANSPTVDAVEVVRCKDCTSYHPYGSNLGGSLVSWGKCMKIDMDVDMPANGYCCYGERRTDA